MSVYLFKSTEHKITKFSLQGTGWVVTKQDSSDADVYAGIWRRGYQACQDVCHHHLSLHHFLGTTLLGHFDQYKLGLEGC